jgi:hypothetical protein
MASGFNGVFMRLTALGRVNHNRIFIMLAVHLLFLMDGCAYDSFFPTHLYFQSLCSIQAGEQIYKTVDNVDGIFQMRIPAKFEKVAHPPLYDHGKLAGSARDASWGKGFWIEDYPSNFEIPPSGRYVTYKSFENQADAPFTMYEFFEGIDQVSQSSGRYVRIRSEPVLVNPCRTWALLRGNRASQVAAFCRFTQESLWIYLD